MLGQRRRRWTNIKAILVQCLSFAGPHSEGIYNVITRTIDWKESLYYLYIEMLSSVYLDQILKYGGPKKQRNIGNGFIYQPRVCTLL